MPTITETPVQAYAHCVEPRCPGNAQSEVDALLVTTAWKYHETGGDGMFSHDERSTEQARFADAEDATCRHCGGSRDLSLSPRMQLDRKFGQPDFLLDIDPDQRFNERTADDVRERLIAEENEKRDDEIKQLREALAEQQKLLLQFLGQQAQQPETAEPESEE